MKNFAMIFIISFVMILFRFDGMSAQSKWTAPPEANHLVSPLTNKGAAAEMGKVYFNSICFVCHGNKGKGDGINAPSLERKPANLTSIKTQKQSDGAIFWKMSEGNPPMLSFKETLTEEIRWQLVAYIRELGQKYGDNGSITSTSVKPGKGKTNYNQSSSLNNGIVSSPEPTINPYKGMNGKEIFKNICGSCHSIGLGRTIGPDLKNVSDRHSREWMNKWVRSSQSVIKSGDPVAVKLYNEYNQIVMPDQPFLSPGQINEVLDYINSKSNPDVIASNNNSGSNLNKSSHVKNKASTSSDRSELGYYLTLVLLIITFSLVLFLINLLLRLIKDISIRS